MKLYILSKDPYDPIFGRYQHVLVDRRDGFAAQSKWVRPSGNREGRAVCKLIVSCPDYRTDLGSSSQSGTFFLARHDEDEREGLAYERVHIQSATNINAEDFTILRYSVVEWAIGVQRVLDREVELQCDTEKNEE